MPDQTVLVTGGAGYIGSHTCKALAEAGMTPVAYDSLIVGNDWAVQWGPFVQGDVRDTEKLVHVIETHKPMAVVHFAAMSNVGISVKDPLAYYDANVTGTVSLLSAMQQTGLDRIVFSSTCAVYGPPPKLPISENTPYGPISPYGHSKLMSEQMLRDLSNQGALRVAAMRYFNAAGADAGGTIGEAHDPETHLIPLLLDGMLGNRPPLTIFGRDYPTPDGTCIRDYIHVTDLADAHVKALQFLDSETGFHAFNIGSGRGFSILELLEAAQKIGGKEVPVMDGPRRAGDPPELVADPSKAIETLGWRAGNSDIETILSTALRWMQRS